MSKSGCRRAAVLAIRVRHAKPSQDDPLSRFHSLGVGVAVMIEPRQMQNAMRHKMRCVLQDRLALGFRLRS